MIASIAESKATSPSDTTVAPSRRNAMLQAAQQRLEKIFHAAGSTVECRFTNGVLQLTGSVTNWHQKQVAQQAVMEVVGAGRVSNEILVSRSAIVSE